jgi:hypothetical protein
MTLRNVENIFVTLITSIAKNSLMKKIWSDGEYWELIFWNTWHRVIVLVYRRFNFYDYLRLLNIEPKPATSSIIEVLSVRKLWPLPNIKQLYNCVSKHQFRRDIPGDHFKINGGWKFGSENSNNNKETVMVILLGD